VATVACAKLAIAITVNICGTTGRSL
jgi:hypothetical protein